MVSIIDPMMLTSDYWKRDQFKRALCISVLDESRDGIGSETQANTYWNSFKTTHPDRSFVLLQVSAIGGQPSGFTSRTYPSVRAVGSSSAYGYRLYDLAPNSDPLPSALMNDVKSSDPKYAYIPQAEVFFDNTIASPRPTSGDPDYGRPDRIWDENGTYYWWNKRTQSYIDIDAINASQVGGFIDTNFLGTPRQYSFIQRWEWEIQWTYSWFDIIDNFAIDVKTNPPHFNNKIFLFIDDSGSVLDEHLTSSYLKFLYDAESYGYDIYVVTNNEERYIDVFETFTGTKVTYQSESDKIGLFMPSDVTKNTGSLLPTPTSATINSYNMRPEKYKNASGDVFTSSSSALLSTQILQKANGDILSWPMPNHSFTSAPGQYKPYKDYPARLFKSAGEGEVKSVVSISSALGGPTGTNDVAQLTTQTAHNYSNGDLILCYGGDLDVVNHPLRNLAFFVRVVSTTSILLYQARSSNFYEDGISTPDLSTYVNADPNTGGIPTGNIQFFIQRYLPVQSIVDRYQANVASSLVANACKSEYITQLSSATPGNQYGVAVIATNPTSTFYSYLNTKHPSVSAGNKYLVTNTKNSIMNFSINIT